MTIPNTSQMIDPHRSGIPTEYAGIVFRSRLEAKWAAMFDMLDWDWEYEPFDMNGYIPDFLLKFYKPLLVEVKPWVKGQDPRPVQTMLDAQPWDGEIWMAAGQLGNFGCDTACGLLRDAEAGWDDAVISQCVVCTRKMLRTSNFSWRCRLCGAEDGNNHLIGFWYTTALRYWREAHNLTQWRPSE